MSAQRRWIALAAALGAAAALWPEKEPEATAPAQRGGERAVVETPAPEGDLRRMLPGILERAGWQGVRDQGGTGLAWDDSGRDTGTPPWGTVPALAWITVLNADERTCISMGESLESLASMRSGCSLMGMFSDGAETGVRFDRDVWIQAMRMDGLLYARSEPLLLEFREGRDLDAVLALPAERTGGLGVQIAMHADGISVEKVWPGTPADEMGLVEGDIIVAVDGQPTGEMELQEFISGMTGPVGSEVDFVLAGGDTGELPMRLTRALLDF